MYGGGGWMGWSQGKGNVGLPHLSTFAECFYTLSPLRRPSSERPISTLLPRILPARVAEGKHDWTRLTGSMAQQDFGKTFRES